MYSPSGTRQNQIRFPQVELLTRLLPQAGSVSNRLSPAPPTLVVILRKDELRLPDVLFRKEINLGDRNVEQLLAEEFRPLPLVACAQQHERFVNYVIGGY